jgi:hypothetical protein
MAAKFPREWPVSYAHAISTTAAEITTATIAHELGHLFASAAMNGDIVTMAFHRRKTDFALLAGSVRHWAPGHPTLLAAITLAGPMAETIYGAQRTLGYVAWQGDRRKFRQSVIKAERYNPVGIVGVLPTPEATKWLTEKGFAVPSLMSVAAIQAYEIASCLVGFMGPFIAEWGSYLASTRTKYISAKQSKVIAKMTSQAKAAVPTWVQYRLGGRIIDLARASKSEISDALPASRRD